MSAVPVMDSSFDGAAIPPSSGAATAERTRQALRGSEQLNYDERLRTGSRPGPPWPVRVQTTILIITAKSTAGPRPGEWLPTPSGSVSRRFCIRCCLFVDMNDQIGLNPLVPVDTGACGDAYGHDQCPAAANLAGFMARLKGSLLCPDFGS